jgi:glycosyltransferase involved in cell wall biosynthesis
MQEPLVSVNITTYNRDKLLPRCIESVISQTYSNIEVIIVDDCSSDNTICVVNDYLQKDSRIKYFRHRQNLGNASARNTAWRNSSGDYIAFMDDDDEWIDVNKLKKQICLFNNIASDYDIICTSVRIMHKNGKVNDKIFSDIPENFYSCILTHNSIVYSPTVLVRREVIEKTNGFDCKVKIGVDADFYREAIYYYNYKVFFINEITTIVHIEHPNSMGRNSNIKAVIDRIKTAEYIKNKYQEYLFNDRFSYYYWDLQLFARIPRLFNINKNSNKCFINALKYLSRELIVHHSIINLLRVIRFIILFVLFFHNSTYHSYEYK